MWDNTAGTWLAPPAWTNTPGEDVTLTYDNVQPGHVYHLAVTSMGYNAGSGTFDLSVDFGVALPGTIDPGDVDCAWHSPNQFGDQFGSLHDIDASGAEIIAIRPEASGPITVYMGSADFDMALGLFDSVGTRLDWDTANSGATAQVSYIGAATATYYLYAGPFDGSSTGLYSLDIDVPTFPVIATIPINTTTGAGSATAPSISPLAHQDFFRITAPIHASGTVTVDMDPDGTALAPYVRLYDESGNMLDLDSSIAGDTAQVTFSGVVGGRSYIIGSGSDYMTTGAYDVDVQFDLYSVPTTVPLLESYGPVSQLGDRTVIFLLSAGDRDNWRFATDTGGLTTFTATGAAGLNPLLALYDGWGNLMAISEDSTGTTEMLTYTLNPREIYTIQAQDADLDSTGTVTLVVNAPSHTPLDFSLYSAGEGSAVQGMGDGNDPAHADPEYFRFTAPAATNGTMVMTGTPNQAFQLEMQLFDGAGDPVGGKYISGVGTPVAHTYTGLTPGADYFPVIIPYQWEDHPAGGGVGISVDFEVPPTVNTLDVSPAPAVQPTPVVLNAMGAADADGDLTTVYFYRDVNANGTYEGIDIYIGSDSSPVDGWAIAVSSGALPLGPVHFLARARDATGQYSDWVTGSTTVIDVIPGDADMSGWVDDLDLAILLGNWEVDPSIISTWGHANFTEGSLGDTDVEDLDLAVLLGNWTGPPPAAATVGTGLFDLSMTVADQVPPTYPGGADYWVIPDVHGDYDAYFDVAVPGEWDGWMFACDVSTTAAEFTATTAGGLVPVIGLYDMFTGNRLSYDDNPTAADTSTFKADIVGSTRYYLMVSGKDWSTGIVYLEMNMRSARISTVIVDTDGQGATTSDLFAPADIDYFSADAPPTANGPLTVRLTNADPTLEGSLGLWDDTAGRWLGLEAVYTPGGDVTLNYSDVLPDHVYHVGVTSLAYIRRGGARHDRPRGRGLRMVVRQSVRRAAQHPQHRGSGGPQYHRHPSQGGRDNHRRHGKQRLRHGARAVRFGGHPSGLGHGRRWVDGPGDLPRCRHGDLLPVLYLL